MKNHEKPDRQLRDSYTFFGISILGLVITIIILLIMQLFLNHETS